MIQFGSYFIKQLKDSNKKNQISLLTKIINTSQNLLSEYLSTLLGMRNESQLRNHSNFQSEEQQDISVMKLNQTLPSQATFLLFILICLSLLANTTRSYDYNVVVGCGIYFISTKNPFIHKMIYFYIMVTLTIVADGLVIVLLYQKVDIFHSFVFPLIEILIKICFLIVLGLQWRKQNEQEKIRIQIKSAQNAHLIKQLQENKKLQTLKISYQQTKLQQKPNPLNYYLPKYSQHNQNNITRQIYHTQQFKEFDNQQFIHDSSRQNQFVSKQTKK